MLKKNKKPSASLIKKAIYFAAEKHHGQYRKGGRVPYFTHPMLVAFKTFEHSLNDDVVVVAILHDVIEDCEVELKELKELFGTKISKIVDEVSAPLANNKKNSTWKMRKSAYLNKIRKASPEGLVVVAADKIINMETYFDAVSNDVKEMQVLFGGSTTDYFWYYFEVLDILKARLHSHTITREYEKVLKYYKTMPSLKNKD